VPLAFLVFAGIVAWSQEPTDVLTRLKESPEVTSLAVEARNANKVEEATAILMDAFRKNSCHKPSPSDGWMSGATCGGLAMGLQALDPDSRAGENYLVQPVEAFLAERIPAPFRDEAAARDKRYTPEYEAWGKARGLSIEETVVLETMYGNFLNLAAFIGDPKLTAVFRRGLQSNGFSIVLSSVRGLALLHDKTALPECLAAIERMKRRGEPGYYLLLGVLRDYNDPEVDRIIAKAPNEEMRNAVLARPRVEIMSELRPKR
jgi:hypothetical protein